MVSIQKILLIFPRKVLIHCAEEIFKKHSENYNEESDYSDKEREKEEKAIKSYNLLSSTIAGRRDINLQEREKQKIIREHGRYIENMTMYLRNNIQQGEFEKIIEQSSNITIIYMNGCNNIKKIPIIIGLRKMYCADCKNLEKIEGNDFRHLYCQNCPKLRTIGRMPKLRHLNVKDCPNLMSLPSQGKRLKYLYCDPARIKIRYCMPKLVQAPLEIKEINNDLCKREQIKTLLLSLRRSKGSVGKTYGDERSLENIMEFFRGPLIKKV